MPARQRKGYTETRDQKEIIIAFVPAWWDARTGRRGEISVCPILAIRAEGFQFCIHPLAQSLQTSRVAEYGKRVLRQCHARSCHTLGSNLI